VQSDAAYLRHLAAQMRLHADTLDAQRKRLDAEHGVHDEEARESQPTGLLPAQQQTVAVHASDAEGSSGAPCDDSAAADADAGMSKAELLAALAGMRNKTPAGMGALFEGEGEFDVDAVCRHNRRRKDHRSSTALPRCKRTRPCRLAAPSRSIPDPRAAASASATRMTMTMMMTLLHPTCRSTTPPISTARTRHRAGCDSAWKARLLPSSLRASSGRRRTKRWRHREAGCGLAATAQGMRRVSAWRNSPCSLLRCHSELQVRDGGESAFGVALAMDSEVGAICASLCLLSALGLRVICDRAPRLFIVL